MKTKRMKKAVALILSAAIAGAAFTGCSGSTSASTAESKKSASKAPSGPPTEITMAFITFGSTPDSNSAAFQEINKIAEKEINVKVHFLPISMGAWSQKTNLMLSGNENLDLMYGFDSSLPNYYSNGQIVSMQQYLKNDGKDIESAVGSVYMRSGQMNGEQYAVPVANRCNGGGYGVVMREDLCKKYEIDTSKITDYDSLESALKVIHQKEPSMYPLVSQENNVSLVDTAHDWDVLSDGIGVLMNKGNSLNVVDLYEQSSYAAKLKMFHKWFTEGLIMKDITTNTESGTTLIKSGKAFASLYQMYANVKDVALDVTQSTGRQVTAVQLIEPYATTSQSLWMLTKNSKNPEKAVQFLNLMYRDPEIMNDLTYGVKGTDYTVEKNSAGNDCVSFPASADMSKSWYATFGAANGWAFPNQKNLYQLKSYDPDYLKNMDAYNRTVTNSKAVGFTFDNSDLTTQSSTLSNVLTQYRVSLEDGVSDPDTVLPQMIKKLKASGLDEYIKAKQTQLTKWAQQTNVK